MSNWSAFGFAGTAYLCRMRSIHQHAEELRNRVLARLFELGFRLQPDGTLQPPVGGKEVIRELHRRAMEKNLLQNEGWIKKNLAKYLSYFASGKEVVPSKVSPILIEVQDEFQAGLFKLARFWWSVPITRGVGKRIRYMIIDKSNGKVMGLVSLASAMIDMPARDKFWGLTEENKIYLVNKTMEANVVGAIPPYNVLLGGKLAAMSLVSNEVRDVYFRKYGGELIAITTMSALGKSSMYNRVKYHDVKISELIGYSGGYGVFHLEDFYDEFINFLETSGRKVYARYETPSWRIKNMRKALRALELPAGITHHGIKREVYLFRVIANLEEYVRSSSAIPIYRDISFPELANYWKERYLLPRADRVDWYGFSKEDIVSFFLPRERIKKQKRLCGDWLEKEFFDD